MRQRSPFVVCEWQLAPCSWDSQEWPGCERIDRCDCGRRLPRRKSQSEEHQGFSCSVNVKASSVPCQVGVFLLIVGAPSAEYWTAKYASSCCVRAASRLLRRHCVTSGVVGVRAGCVPSVGISVGGRLCGV